MFKSVRIIVRGGGDLASGAIYRLFKAGFPVIVLELEAPLLVRRAVCYGDAVFEGERVVEGIAAQRVESVDAANAALEAGIVPVLVDQAGEMIAALQPTVIVDGRMEKHNPGTTIYDAPLVIGMGPGYTAGEDCHAVVETNRGHHLGRVYWHGSAEADTGEPGSVGDKTYTRVLRAPAGGYVAPFAAIGDLVARDQVIASVNGQPVIAPFEGMVRGLIHPKVRVSAGMKIGDLDPRISCEHCFTISDKSLAVGGGVLEAVLSSARVREVIERG